MDRDGFRMRYALLGVGSNSEVYIWVQGVKMLAKSLKGMEETVGLDYPHPSVAGFFPPALGRTQQGREYPHRTNPPTPTWGGADLRKKLPRARTRFVTCDSPKYTHRWWRKGGGDTPLLPDSKVEAILQAIS